MLNRLLINKQFAQVWLSGAISWIGDFVFDVTVLLWISTVLAKGEPWAPAAASGVLIAVLVPTVLVGPLVGVFVDRWDPRRTMLWSDAIAAVLVGSLVILPMLPPGTLPVSAQLVIIYVVVVLNTIVSRFFTPARFVITADVVPEADQPRASSISQATSATAGIIGPPLAAPLLFTAGVQWALIINALTFVLSFALIWNVRVPRAKGSDDAAEERGGFLQEFWTGLRAVLSNRIVLALMITGMIANIAAQVFNALGVFFVINNLHTDAKYFGLQETMIGIGALIGAAIAGWVGTRIGLGRTVWISMLVCGLMLGIYARMTSFAVALAVLLLFAIPIGSMNSVGFPLLMRKVPREVLGRVIATFLPAVQSVSIIGIGIAGWLSSSVLHGLDTSIVGIHFGTYDTIFLAGAVIVVIAGVYGAVGLRGADDATAEMGETATEGESVDPVDPADTVDPTGDVQRERR